MKTILYTLAVLCLFCCEKKHSEQPAPLSVPTPAPSPTETLLPTLFHDDFVDNRNNWHMRDDDTLRIAIDSGSLYLTNKEVYTYGAYFPKGVPIDTLKDFDISASITEINSQNEDGYGLIWGDKDKAHQYRFVITQSGYFSVEKNLNGWVELIPWTLTSAVLPVHNVLRISKRSNTLLFYLNKTQVGSTPFQSFFGPSVGFVMTNEDQTIAVDYLDVAQ